MSAFFLLGGESMAYERVVIDLPQVWHTYMSNNGVINLHVKDLDYKKGELVDVYVYRPGEGVIDKKTTVGATWDERFAVDLPRDYQGTFVLVFVHKGLDGVVLHAWLVPDMHLYSDENVSYTDKWFDLVQQDDGWAITIDDVSWLYYKLNDERLYRSNDADDRYYIGSDERFGWSLIYVTNSGDLFANGRAGSSCPWLIKQVWEKFVCSLNLYQTSWCGGEWTIWRMDENDEWELFAWVYSYGDGSESCGMIYKSTNSGDSRYPIYGGDGASGRHMHFVAVDPYTQYIYAAQWDDLHRVDDAHSQSMFIRSTDGGYTREVLEKWWRSNYTTIAFLPWYRIVGEDAAQKTPSSRLLRTHNDKDFQVVYTLEGVDSANWWTSHVDENNVVYMSTLTEKTWYKSGLYMSTTQWSTRTKLRSSEQNPDAWQGIGAIAGRSLREWISFFYNTTDSLYKISSSK